MSRGALADMARKLGGDVVGQQVLCPGPGHSRADRSLSVRLSSTAPEGFVVYTHATGDGIFECRDHVRQMLGWDRPDRRAERPQYRRTNQHVDQGDAAKVAMATAIWREAVDPRRTLVERHLASRGLELPDEVAGEAIRFHSACPWRDEPSGQTIRVPAMVAAMRSIVTEEITGVHRTRLTSDGRKVDRRMLGKASGAAVMLTPYSAVGAGLAIGEGIETTIAGMLMGWRAAWALGSVGGIERFPLITGLQSLTIFAETGDNGASERATNVAGERYYADGREVILVEPKCTGDLNDVLRGAA